MTKTVPPITQIVLHGAPNDGGNNDLPPPAVSPTPSHHSQHRRGALILFQSRWKSFKDAIKKGTGYSTKPMEWSSSLLNLSDHENSADDDPDAILDDEDLTWLSGQNGEDPLALILVDREPSTASQTSPNFTSSQENVTRQYGLNSANKTDVPNDQTYRLKTYELSVQDSQHGAINPITWIRYRAFPWLKRAVLRYLYPVFSDPVVEDRYSERVYNSQKFLAFVCSIYLLISWIIALTLLRKVELSDIIFFWALAPALTAPLPFMIFYDVPRRFPRFYQLFLVLSVWSWSAYLISFMELCRYYGGGKPVFSCNSRDFMNLFYYMVALPVIALFGMGQERLYATIAPIIMIITPSVLFIPRKNPWIRYALEHIFLQALLLYIHWKREILERSVYYANKKVKDTLIALHHTRLHQSRVEAARARSTSYIFHEVRQPLNAAFLAYQNLAASITIKQEHLFEWDTLRIKLISMSKLLNDVLDQKRMDAGKFEIVSRPFAFHQVVRQTIFGCRMAMDQKQQEMIIDLDQNIDIAARTASYQAKGKSEDETHRAMAAFPAEDGIVSGDETRLTQVLTNLVNNATKFTPDHGKIRIKTQLLSPVPLRPVAGPSSSRIRTHSRLLSAPTDGRSQSSSGTLMNGPSKWDDDTNRLVVRIEVSDTGCGISPSDVKDRALFSPYAQAGIGRLQGGSGTGLGVSLVRRIVKLMGGRMGVESLPGAGTTFWVEFPLRFTTGKESQRDPLPPPLMSSPMSSYSTGTKTRVGSAGGSLTAAPPMSPENTQQIQAPPTMPATEVVSAASKPKVGVDLSVLVVDDDLALRGLLQRLLQRLGCRVETAENGKVALQKLGVDLQRGNEPSISSSRLLLSDDPEAGPIQETPRNYYDIVFMDNQMPIVSGHDAVSALRKSNRRDFVVGLTGDADPVSQARFKQAGADEVLSKPVHETQLRMVLEKARERTALELPSDSPQEHRPP